MDIKQRTQFMITLSSTELSERVSENDVIDAVQLAVENGFTDMYDIQNAGDGTALFVTTGHESLAESLLDNVMTEDEKDGIDTAEFNAACAIIAQEVFKLAEQNKFNAWNNFKNADE